MAKRTCAVETCKEPVKTRGWCNAHYQKVLKYGDPLVIRKKVGHSACVGPDCHELIEGNGMCRTHYRRWKKTGDPQFEKPVRAPGPRGDVEARFFRLVDKDGPEARNNPECGRCWIKIGARHWDGYVIFEVNRRTFPMHKWAYLWWVGSIPDGLVLDHFACDNGQGGCVNPYHVRPVTNRENILRGRSAEAEKTHCPQGHAYDDANTYRTEMGRKCRACAREGNMRRYRARMAAGWRRRQGVWVPPEVRMAEVCATLGIDSPASRPTLEPA